MRPITRHARTAAALLAVLALAVTTGCSSSSPGGGDGDTKKSIIVVTPTPLGSNNFLQLAVAGAKRAAKKHQASLKTYQSTDPTSIQQNVDAAVRAKPDIVIGISFSVQDVIEKTAADNPDQSFLLVDACPEKPTKNLTCASFKEYEASYLTGVEAGLLTRSGKIGVIAAQDNPFVRRWVDPFADGVKSVNPKAKVTPLFVGGSNPFNDAPRAKAQAQVLADKGVDYVQAAASGGNLGVFEAAKASDLRVFGVDTNQCPSAPGYVVDNVLKRVDVALEAAVGEIIDGNAGGVKVYGLAEDGVGISALEPDLAKSKCTIAKNEDVIAKVKQVRQDIVDGKTKVKDPVTG